AWAAYTGAASDVYVSRYDPAAGGGAGAWVPLGAPFNISGTGAADRAVLVQTASGLVVAWLDTAARPPHAHVKRFSGGAWSALGAGAAGGTGVSGSATPVTDLAVATDGTKVAVSWSQAAGGAREIYLREYNGSWSELGGSATGGGVSSTAGLSVA